MTIFRAAFHRGRRYWVLSGHVAEFCRTEVNLLFKIPKSVEVVEVCISRDRPEDMSCVYRCIKRKQCDRLHISNPPPTSLDRRYFVLTMGGDDFIALAKRKIGATQGSAFYIWIEY